MELRHLRYFVAVAESLHFGKAASKLGIAQPSLSQQISQLESELDTVLLARTKRRVALTQAGQLFLQEARQILARAELAGALARRIGAVEAHFRVGLGYQMDQMDIAAVIGEFRDRHQGTQVETLMMSVPAQLTALLNGQLDIGFVRPPVNDQTLYSEVVASEPLLLALPRNHPFAQRTHLPLSALANEPIVLPRREAAPVLHAAIMEACRKAGFLPRIWHEADHLSMVLDLAAAGAGIALVPATARRVERDRVVYRLPDPPADPLETALAWRREDKSSLLTEFIGLAKRTLTRASSL